VSNSIGEQHMQRERRQGTLELPAFSTSAFAALWCGGVATVVLALFGARGFDDPYVTYRYAQNLATGRGFVYNQGEYVLSTTTPLYTLLLAVVGVAGFDIPWASNAIGCVSLGLGAWTLWALSRGWGWTWAAMVVLLVLPLSPLLVLTLGLETVFGLALVLLGILLYERRRWHGAAIVWALATLTRFDAVLALAVVIAYGVFARRERPPWRAVVLYGALLAPWLLFATWYFGAPTPATLAAKQRQALMPQSDSFIEGLLPFFKHYWTVWWLWPHFACAMLGAGAAILRYRRSGLVLSWIALYVVAYMWLGVTRYQWYYAPVVVGVIMCIALGVQACAALVQRWQGTRAAWWSATVLCVVLLAGQLSSLVAFYGVQNGRLRIYRTVGEWFATHTAPDASIGTLEVGIIGYYSERRIVDFAGLLQPATATHLGPRSSYEDAALWATQQYEPEYVLLQDRHYPRLETLLAERGGCRPVNAWTDPAYTSRLVAYGCAWP
jgi:hypothetical protein